MPNSKDIELILNSIRKKRSMTYMKSLFRTVNKLYRDSIDKAQAKFESIGVEEVAVEDDRRTKIKYPAITLAQLKEVIPDGETIITEIDMVTDVFSVVRDEVTVSVSSNEPLREYHHLLTVVMSYCESLLSYYIYPHKRLQIFLFDICVESRNYSTLQQLISFHVILDSSDVLEKLESILHLPWVPQCRLDAAKRVGNTRVVIESLLAIGRPDEIVPYVRVHDPSYNLDNLFQLLPISTHRQIWKQIELWNVSPGKTINLPVLSREIIMSMDSP
jgi:hypothetical protein